MHRLNDFLHKIPTERHTFECNYFILFSFAYSASSTMDRPVRWCCRLLVFRSTFRPFEAFYLRIFHFVSFPYRTAETTNVTRQKSRGPRNQMQKSELRRIKNSPLQRLTASELVPGDQEADPLRAARRAGIRHWRPRCWSGATVLHGVDAVLCRLHNVRSHMWAGARGSGSGPVPRCQSFRTSRRHWLPLMLVRRACRR